MASYGVHFTFYCWNVINMCYRMMFFVILQQKILIKSDDDDDDDDDGDIQNNQGVARSFDIQGHEVCIPTAAFSVKTEPEVGPVSLSFCSSYSHMRHFVVVVVVVVVVQVIHNMK